MVWNVAIRRLNIIRTFVKMTETGRTRKSGSQDHHALDSSGRETKFVILMAVAVCRVSFQKWF